MINKIIQGLRLRLSDPFWKNVATLFSGSAIAQALPILILPIITRIYTKEALGFYFVYAAIGMLTQIGVSLQYHLAIVLPKKEEDSYRVLTVNFILIGIISILLFLFIWIFYDFIASFIEQKELLKWLFAIPVSAFLLGIFNAISYFFNREKKYKLISIGKVTKSLTFSVLHIAFGVLGFLNSGLIMGLIIGQLASSIYLLYCLFKKSDFNLQYNITELKTVFLRYKDIPLFNTIISFLNTLSNQLPLFMLTRFFGAGAAGDYGLANRMITTPMGLIGQSVGQVFYQEAATIHNRGGSLNNLVRTTYKRLFKIGIIPFVLIAIFSPLIFKLVFGADYVSSGIITQILVPWLLIMFLNSPLTFIITVLNKQKQMIFYDVILLTFRFLSLFVGYVVFNSLLISVALFSLVGFVLNVILLVYFLYISKKTIENVYD